jgi:general secretion pathway protein G
MTSGARARQWPWMGQSMTRGRRAFCAQRSAFSSQSSEFGDRRSRHPARPGFTLIEILIVITIIGILITLAQPSYQRAVSAAREATLKENLFVLRDVIDQFYADNGKYPGSLNDLVEKAYIRRIPKDPITNSTETWVLVQATDEHGQQAGVYDVKSGSEAVSRDGTKFSDW